MGHSNRYFLNDPVPVLDSRIGVKEGIVCAVDDDGCILLYASLGWVKDRYGLDAVENYRYTPMCQYFASDYESLVENTRIPLDSSTNQLAELIPNGPLLDYLRMPYQFQQQREIPTHQWLELREQEVKANDKRMEETAQQERVGKWGECEK